MNKKNAPVIVIGTLLIFMILIGIMTWLNNRKEWPALTPSPLATENDDSSLERTLKDFTYSIKKHDKKDFLSIKPIDNCLNFEADFEASECKRYNYQYARAGNNLKITLTDLENCYWNLASYGIEGKICNLARGKYTITIEETGTGVNLLKENAEIK